MVCELSKPQVRKALMARLQMANGRWRIWGKVLQMSGVYTLQKLSHDTYNFVTSACPVSLTSHNGNGMRIKNDGS